MFKHAFGFSVDALSFCIFTVFLHLPQDYWTAASACTKHTCNGVVEIVVEIEVIVKEK